MGALRRYPAFRFLWASNLGFFTGVWMQTLVLGWVTYEVTNSEFLLAVFTAARLFPMLLGPIGGLLADRIDRIQLLIWSQVFVFGVSVALAFLVLTDRIEYSHLLIGGFLIGLTQAPVQPTRTTLIMDIVAREDVSNAVALNTIALSVTRVIGPALGGALIALLDSGLTLLLSSACYVAGALAVLPIRELSARVAPKARPRFTQDLIEGFRIVLGDSKMRAVVFITLAANICAWPVLQAFMPVFARDILEVGVSGLAILMTASGLGAIVGAFYIASLGDFQWKGTLYIWGTGFFGLFFALFAITHSFPLAVALMAGVGFASATFGVLQATLLLLLAPAEVRGRAMGIQVLAIGILPIATLAQGAVASVVGVATMTIIAGSALFAVMSLIFVTSPGLRAFRSEST
jgi:MFS family permease